LECVNYCALYLLDINVVRTLSCSHNVVKNVVRTGQARTFNCDFDTFTPLSIAYAFSPVETVIVIVHRRRSLQARTSTVILIRLLYVAIDYYAFSPRVDNHI
jgi:hypothetical protein